MPFEGGNMKRALSVIALTLISAIPAFSLTFDIKVKAKDSLKLTPLQAGLTYYLFEGGDKVLPFSEDYAIWLESYQRITEGNLIKVSFTMKLSEAAFIKETKTLSTVRVDFEYTLDQVQEDFKGRGGSPLKETRMKLERFGKQTAFEARIGGKAAAEKLPELLRSAGISKEGKVAKKSKEPKD
jgi:hypothetical protein